MSQLRKLSQNILQNPLLTGVIAHRGYDSLKKAGKKTFLDCIKFIWDVLRGLCKGMRLSMEHLGEGIKAGKGRLQGGSGRNKCKTEEKGDKRNQLTVHSYLVSMFVLTVITEV